MTTPFMRERARGMRHLPTEAEQRFWFHVRNRRLCGRKFRRQVWLGPYIVDFLCEEAGLIVEIDGSQHVEQQVYDCARTCWLEARGYRVVRFWSNDVLEQTEYVLESLRLVLEAEAPHPRCARPLPRER